MRNTAANPSKRVLRIHHRFRTQRLDRAQLRRHLRHALENHLHRPVYELSVHFIGDAEMRRLNERFARHAGTTDVLTFDYSDYDLPNRPAPAPDRRRTRRTRTKASPGGAALRGECFICVPEAVRQAPRYGVAWQTEVTRYAIHGLLHLCGWNDDTASERRTMKSLENRLVRVLTRRAPTARSSPAKNQLHRRP